VVLYVAWKRDLFVGVGQPKHTGRLLELVSPSIQAVCWSWSARAYRPFVGVGQPEHTGQPTNIVNTVTPRGSTIIRREPRNGDPQPGHGII